MAEKIVLGSGKLYITEATFTDGVVSIPDDEVLEVSANLLGLIQGGAALQYTPTFYTAKDDLGLVSKTFLTEEEAVLTSGIMTWNANTLAKLCSTADITTTATNKTVKIGGVGNYDGKSYIIRFLHEDASEGDIRITIIGSNEAGFELSFAQDKETVIDAEFKAIPHDKRGTLIIYDETIVE